MMMMPAPRLPDATTQGNGEKERMNEENEGSEGERDEKHDGDQPQRPQQPKPPKDVWCVGTVVRYDRPSGRHVILYDEGTEEMVDFGGGTRERLGRGNGGCAASSVAWVPVGHMLTHADVNRGRRYRHSYDASMGMAPGASPSGPGPGAGAGSHKSHAAMARLMAARRRRRLKDREGLERWLLQLCSLVLETVMEEEHAEVFALPVDTVRGPSVRRSVRPSV